MGDRPHFSQVEGKPPMHETSLSTTGRSSNNIAREIRIFRLIIYSIRIKKKRIMKRDHLCLHRQQLLLMVVLLVPWLCHVGVVSSFSYFQPRAMLYQGGNNIMTVDESSTLRYNNMRRGGRSHCKNHRDHHPRPISRILLLGAARQDSKSDGINIAGTNDEEEEVNKDKAAATAAAAVDFSNFNPFDYKKSTHSSNSAYSYSRTQISLRKTQMQELVNDMLNVVQENNDNVNAVMQEILNSSKDMLLEPLEDIANAVLDPDSIYSPNMTRIERYQAYRASMEERISKAKNPQVRLVLQELKDFVLSFE